MQIDVNQFMFFWFLFSVAVSAFMIWLFYYCIKCGVRDGINEARPMIKFRDFPVRVKHDNLPEDMRVD